ncbi:MAG TPA: STAS domain-containing protein [Solirubrobacterales bacterium]
MSLSTAASAFALPSPFACSWKRDGLDSAWLHLRGEVDLSTSHLFAQALDDAQVNAGTVSIDLQELTFIDCSALQVIAGANARARSAGRRLTLVRGFGQVDRVLKLTGLLEEVEVVDMQKTQTAKTRV